MNQTLISIIIPVCNAENQLRRCLDSIVNQTYSNLEIILVDDASSDGSYSILKEYSEKDERINIVRNLTNRGSLYARVCCFEKIKGECVLMVDADDYMELTCIEKVVDTWQKSQADIVQFGYTIQRASDDTVKQYAGKWYFVGNTLAGDDVFNAFKKCSMNHTLWNKMYAVGVIKEALSQYLNNYEQLNRVPLQTDYLINLCLFKVAQSYVEIEDELYTYTLNPSSITGGGDYYSMSNVFEKYHKSLEWVEYFCDKAKVDLDDLLHIKNIPRNILMYFDISNTILPNHVNTNYIKSRIDKSMAAKRFIVKYVKMGGEASYYCLSDEGVSKITKRKAPKLCEIDIYLVEHESLYEYLSHYCTASLWGSACFAINASNNINRISLNAFGMCYADKPIKDGSRKSYLNYESIIELLSRNIPDIPKDMAGHEAGSEIKSDLMPKLPKVSIVVPAYNAEQYLEKGLNSLVNQTYPNCEIICVDDGSTDGTLDILKKYASKYENLMYTSLPQNTGLLNARKQGFYKSTGDYIIAMDADDALTTTIIAESVNVALSQSADLVHFGCLLVKDHKRQKFAWAEVAKECLNNEQYFDLIYTSSLSHNYTCRLYKRSILAKTYDTKLLDFDNSVNYWEDLMFHLVASYYVNKYAPLPSYGYLRLHHEHSMTGGTLSPSYLTTPKALDAFRLLYDVFKKTGSYLANGHTKDKVLQTIHNMMLDKVREKINSGYYSSINIVKYTYHKKESHTLLHLYKKEVKVYSFVQSIDEKGRGTPKTLNLVESLYLKKNILMKLTSYKPTLILCESSGSAIGLDTAVELGLLNRCRFCYIFERHGQIFFKQDLLKEKYIYYYKALKNNSYIKLFKTASSAPYRLNLSPKVISTMLNCTKENPSYRPYTFSVKDWDAPVTVLVNNIINSKKSLVPSSNGLRSFDIKNNLLK